MHPRGLAGNRYTGYQDIKDISQISQRSIKGYREKIDQISIKSLADSGRILNISAGYTWILVR